MLGKGRKKKARPRRRPAFKDGSFKISVQRIWGAASEGHRREVGAEGGMVSSEAFYSFGGAVSSPFSAVTCVPYGL